MEVVPNYGNSNNTNLSLNGNVVHSQSQNRLKTKIVVMKTQNSHLIIRITMRGTSNKRLKFTLIYYSSIHYFLHTIQ